RQPVLKLTQSDSPRGQFSVGLFVGNTESSPEGVIGRLRAGLLCTKIVARDSKVLAEQKTPLLIAEESPCGRFYANNHITSSRIRNSMMLTVQENMQIPTCISTSKLWRVDTL